jgi:hypothetical protein
MVTVSSGHSGPAISLGRETTMTAFSPPSLNSSLPFAKPLLVPLTQRSHYVVAVMAIPLARLEPAPLNVGIKDALHRVEVAPSPGFQALGRNRYGITAHVNRIDLAKRSARPTRQPSRHPPVALGRPTSHQES